MFFGIFDRKFKLEKITTIEKPRIPVGSCENEAMGARSIVWNISALQFPQENVKRQSLIRCYLGLQIIPEGRLSKASGHAKPALGECPLSHVLGIAGNF